MKRVLHICAVAALTLSSCVQDVDDVFDSPASERVRNTAKEFRELLVGNKNGWVMEYYPDSKRSYGGYVYTLSFDGNDNVTVRGERDNDPDAEKTSLYSIGTDMSVTLNFDTYNEIFHYLSDPDPDYASIYGFHEGELEAGDGYKGDYEFVLRSKSDDEIILQGKKTGNRIRLTPLQEPAGSYLTKLIAMKRKVADVPFGTVGFKGTLDGKELYFKEGRKRHFTVYYDGEEVGSVAACPTVEGIKLYEPIEVAGRSMQNFSFAGNTYTCIDQGVGDITFKSYKDPLLGNYKLTYRNSEGELSTGTVLFGKEDDTYYLQTDAFIGGITIPVDYDEFNSRIVISFGYILTTIELEGATYYVVLGAVSKRGYLGFGEEYQYVANAEQGKPEFKFKHQGEFKVSVDGQTISDQVIGILFGAFDLNLDYIGIVDYATNLVMTKTSDPAVFSLEGNDSTPVRIAPRTKSVSVGQMGFSQFMRNRNLEPL